MQKYKKKKKKVSLYQHKLLYPIENKGPQMPRQ